MKLHRTSAKTTGLGVFESIFEKLLKDYVDEEGKKAEVRNVSKFVEQLPDKAKEKVKNLCDKYPYVFVVECSASQYSSIKTSIKDFFKEIFSSDVNVAVLKTGEDEYKVIVPVDFRLVLFNPQK